MHGIGLCDGNERVGELNAPAWMVFELNGYKFSFKSWSELADDLADDEEEKRKDEYADTYVGKDRRMRNEGGFRPSLQVSLAIPA